jgi:hypothetical protein
MLLAQQARNRAHASHELDRPFDLQCELGDSLLVPLDALAGPVGDDQITVLDLEELGQYRVGPILSLEPARGVGDTQKMRRHLRVEVRGHQNAPHARDRGRAQLPADTANAREIGHDMVARAREDRVIQQARAAVVTHLAACDVAL